jgi:hypothetical protein
MKRARLVLTSVLVVVCTATVAAEGAWVVWKQTVGTDSEAWSVQETYLNRPQCQGFGITMALTQNVRMARENPDHRDFQRGEDGRSYTFSKTKPDGSGAEPVHVRFVCLRDSVDPREKQKE